MTTSSFVRLYKRCQFVVETGVQDCYCMLLVRPPTTITWLRLFKPNELIKRLSDDVGLALSYVSWISHVAAHAFSKVLAGLPISAAWPGGC